MKEEIKRVKEMEKILGEQTELLERVNKIIDEFNEKREDYIKLRDYYSSEIYFEDLKKDKEGMFKDMPTGIFSEDLIYNLLGDYFNTGVKMCESGLDAIKKY